MQVDSLPTELWGKPQGWCKVPTKIHKPFLTSGRGLCARLINAFDPPSCSGRRGLCAHFQMGLLAEGGQVTCPRSPCWATAEPRDEAVGFSIPVVGVRLGGGAGGVNTCFGGEDSIHQLAQGLALSRSQGANPYEVKGTKSGHLLMGKKARAAPVKGQRVPVRAPQQGDQVAPAVPMRRAPPAPRHLKAGVFAQKDAAEGEGGQARRGDPGRTRARTMAGPESGAGDGEAGPRGQSCSHRVALEGWLRRWEPVVQ